MELNYIEYYIIPLMAAITFILLSLFFFSKTPYIDITIKAIILAAVIFLSYVFILPANPIIISIKTI